MLGEEGRILGCGAVYSGKSSPKRAGTPAVADIFDRDCPMIPWNFFPSTHLRADNANAWLTRKQIAQECPEPASGEPRDRNSSRIEVRKLSEIPAHNDTDQPIIKTRTFPFPKRLRTVAAMND